MVMAGSFYKQLRAANVPAATLRRSNPFNEIGYQFIGTHELQPRGRRWRQSRQRRFCPSLALLPSEPTVGTVAIFARSAAVFFGFLISRFDLFCPFAMCNPQ
jgi:hypothetical protein